LEAISSNKLSIPMGNNCAPLLADLILHSYEVEFIQALGERKEN